MWRRQAGFTLVELILVLILISVLAVSAIGLFSTKGGYTARTTADLILAQARVAQQVALGRALASNVSFSVSRSSDEMTLGVTQDSFSSSRTTDVQDVTVSWKESGTTSCTGGSTSDFTMQFNRNGDAFSPGGNPVNTLICVVGSQTIPICISSLGYAYEGLCDS
ncbi:type II secretory pathway pseudopilin PulG [Hahella sp. CCB-MM4]|uniref:prepilin-type N-terminal cleavage/methylation domain-containing protein n=1 Tax=Hahella sp. (strain CCB-MM4) TaxID=1926491 RepID=UPI000B9B960E|nr:prepilin-type N-terminal cleavage/methylation domain-containing protein [Hahella sp. CCB-MM4]OZG70849.1 type II secretory pathway pseudopilin PulG [Hahella sp. CCB-MM4]